jgi:hypothetical protein
MNATTDDRAECDQGEEGRFRTVANCLKERMFARSPMDGFTAFLKRPLAPVTLRYAPTSNTFMNAASRTCVSFVEAH